LSAFGGEKGASALRNVRFNKGRESICVLGAGWTTTEGEKRMTTSFQAARSKKRKGREERKKRRSPANWEKRKTGTVEDVV
jgi:hypothetical protein